METAELHKNQALVHIIKHPEGIKNLGIRECEGIVKSLNQLLKDPERGKYPDFEKAIIAARRAAYTRRRELMEYQGSNIFPRELFSADQLAPRLLNDEKTQQAAISLNSNVTPATIKAFNRPESKHILETVVFIMDEYRRGLTDSVYMDGSNYLIDIDFKELLKRSGATGEMRKRIKAMINKALAGEGQPMQYVTVKKGNQLATYSFLTIKKALQKNTDRLARINTEAQNPGVKIERLQLEVSAEAFACLAPLIDKAGGYIPKGELKKNKSMGYLETPAMLTRKIENVTNELIHKCSIVPTDSPLRPKIDDLTIERMNTKQPEYWRDALFYIIERWETGKQRRKKNPMTITWAQLRKNSFLSAHKNNPEKRRSDMLALAIICEVLRRENEILAGSKSNLSVNNGDQKGYKFPVPGEIVVYPAE